MSTTFAGLLCLGPGRRPDDFVDGAKLLAALSPGRPPELTSVWNDGPLLLVQAGDQGAGTLPVRCPATGRVAAFWGRLDNGDELGRALNRTPNRSGNRSGPVAPVSDPELVLAAHGLWDGSCPERLAGDFAGAVCEPGAHRALLFRDRLGVKPLYYLLDPEFLLFATTAAVFPLLRRGAPAVDPAWLARALTGVHHDPTATAFTGVARLAPGHRLDVHPGGGRPGPYHSWRDDPQWTTRRDPARVAEYRTVLEEAVRCRMRAAGRMGSENSGGLDSSTVTSYLAHLLGDPGDRLSSFGLVLAEREPEYMAETNRHAGITHGSLLTLPPGDDALIGRGLAAVGYPEEQHSAIAHVPIYEECRRRGIGVLFSGFGGDEAVTNSGSLLGRELLDHRAYRALGRFLPGGRLTRTLRLARALALGPRWGGSRPGLAAAMAARWPHHLVRTELARQLGLAEAHRAQAAFDGPYRRINAFVIGDRLGASMLARLETCTLVAASYGVEFRWPLLDTRLVQQYLSTPSIEKADRTAGRYLHRRAVEGVVPAKVAWKSSKDMSGPEDRARAAAGQGGRVAPGRVEQARRQVAHLHPALEEVIDVDRFRRQIAAAADLPLSPPARTQFASNVTRLRTLNHWLCGGPAPA